MAEAARAPDGANDGRTTTPKPAEAARASRTDLPALLTTGYAGTALDDQLASGMEVIGKPFALDALAAQVRAMLEAFSAP